MFYMRDVSSIDAKVFLDRAKNFTEESFHLRPTPKAALCLWKFVQEIFNETLFTT